MICPRCQTPNADAAAFCVSCGYPLSAQPAPTSPNSPPGPAAWSTPLTPPSSGTQPPVYSSPPPQTYPPAEGQPYPYPGYAPPSTPYAPPPGYAPSPGYAAPPSTPYALPSPYAPPPGYAAPPSTPFMYQSPPGTQPPAGQPLMQAELITKLRRQDNRGPLTAGIGGIIGLFAFFALPQITAFGLVSVTGAQIASAGNSLPNQTLACVLWVLPLIFGVSVFVGARSFFRQRILKEGAGLLIAGGIIGALVLIGEYIYVNSSLSSLGAFSVAVGYGIGYWLSLLSMVAVAVGGYFIGSDG